MSFSLPPNTTPPDAAVASEALGKLRAECETTADEARRGILLHEIGVLEDNSHNEGQAARDLLSAVNTLPAFHEPLERLVAIIERRKSYKNLGKLLDRLVKVAESPEELSRALVALAELKEDHEGDADGAREALERATQAKGDDVDAWLALERIAARSGDAETRRRALAARADLATDPAWRALLSLDVGRLHAAAGNPDGAIAAIERALEAKSAVSFTALAELERASLGAGWHARAARALEERAGLIGRALEGGTDAEASGVPEEHRTAGHVAEAWLRAAELYRHVGETDRAVALLDRVVERLPDDPVAIGARLRAAEAAGDTLRAAELARKELSQGVHGPAAAALWMRVTEAAASGGDAQAALGALASALEEDPGCIPAHTLELDLLSGMGDQSALAQALEAAASQLGSEPLAAQLYLLAADSAARGAGDVNAAKASLSQAAASGAALDVVARTGRMLAALTNDAAWFDEATRRLLASNPPEGERPGLSFELGRARLLRGDVAGAMEAFASLASVPGGAWLGNVLRAYSHRAKAETGQAGSAGSGAPGLEGLADLAGDPAIARAYRTAAALRYQQAGLLDDATRTFETLHEADPADVLAATALATSYRRNGEAVRAAEVLARAAAEVPAAAVAAALNLEGGILRWLAGDRTQAISVFDGATRFAPEAASGLLAWALRAAQPNDLGARRRALDAAEPYEDRAAVAVERFALEAGSDGDRSSAAGLLDDVVGEGAIRTALDVARALDGSPDARAAALLRLAEASPEAAGIALASTHFGTLASAGVQAAAREATAVAWAGADDSLAASVEVLAHALAARDVDGEIAARELVAARLPAPLSELVLASARIVARLSHDDLDSALVVGNTPEVRLTNLELAPPCCDPRRRAVALLDGGPALDEPSRGPALSLAGWNLLAASDSAGAIRAFRSYVELHPEDIVGWEGLRASAEHAGNKPLLAEASAALGDLVSDAGQGAELWERAASLLLDDLGDAASGETALARAVERDIGRHEAFDRLFRIVRARRDGPRLLELIEARLAVAEDSAEIAKLYWERARVLRETGNAAGALEALDNVTLLEPDHVGALALTGEIYITEKRFAEAAENLARLAALSDAPQQQRLMSGIAAVDLFENRLGQSERALEVLVNLHRSGLATMPVRERLARTAAKTESWETATTVLEELMAQRETREGRIEAARLALAVHRDRLGSPGGAEHAVERLLLESPSDGEALDLVLSGALPAPLGRKLLERGRDAVVEALILSPLDLEQMTRLAEIARQLHDVQLRQVALGGVVALGGQTPQFLSELAALDGRVARTPQIAIDDRVIESLRDPEDRGPIAALLSALAPTLAEALGPGLAALGVTKKERVRPQDGLPVRNEVAAWAGALGLGEFELYVGGRNPDGVYAVPTEVPAIVVGAAVAHPLSALHRAALARELIALKLGITILRHRDPTEIAALVTAACNIAGVRLESPPYAMLAEFERLLSKEMPRRVRKLLPELASPVASSHADPVAWLRAATSSLDRMASVAIGDVSWVLAATESTRRGDAPQTSEDKLRTARLLSFVLSPTFFAARDKLGMGVR